MSLVPLVDRDGKIVEVLDSEAPGLLRIGYRVPTPVELQQAATKSAQEAEFGSLAQQMITGAESAASALTLGASPAIEQALGVPAADILARREENPTADVVGTGLGIGLPILATLGGSAPAAAAATGLRAGARQAAKYTAPGVISNLGRAATELTAGALPATSTAGRIASSAAALGAGSAVEGAAYGLGQVVDEAVLGDPRLTAESAFAQVGMGAIFGGALGGILGASAVAVPAAVTRAKNAVGSVFSKTKGAAEKWYSGAQGMHGVQKPTAELIIDHQLELDVLQRQVPGIVEKISQANPGVAAAIIDDVAKFGALEKEFPGISKTLVMARPDTLAFVLKNADEFARFEREFPGALRNITQADPATAEFFKQNWPKLFRPGNDAERSALLKAVRQGGDEVLDSVDDLFRKAYGDMMRAGADDLLADANPRAVVEAYSSMFDKANDAIAKMESRPSLFDKYYPAKLREILEDIAKDAGKAADPAAAFKHLTRLRQELGANISWGKRALLPPAERDAQDLMLALYRETSETLRNPAVFGQAGAAKAMLDDAFSEWQDIIKRTPGAQLGHSQRGTNNFNFLLMKGGELDPGKINTWFNKFGDDTAFQKTEAWGEMMDAAKRAVDAVENLHKMAPATKFERAEVDALLKKVADTTTTAGERAEVMRRFNDLDPRAVLRGSHAALPGDPMMAGSGIAETVNVTQQAASMAGHGVVGSTLRVALAPVAKAADTATHISKTVAALAALERMGKRVSTSIDSGVSTLVRAGVKSSYVGRGYAAAGIGSSFARSPEDAERDFKKQVAEVNRLRDPATLHAKLTEQTRGLHDHAPGTAEALSVTSARAVAFLASKMPQPPAKKPLGPEWAPSRAEIAKWNRYSDAVEDPLSILKQASAGTLTPEAVEAVSTVYPELMAQIRLKLVERIGKGEVPYKQRLMVGMLLGNVDVDGTLSPSMMARTQAAFAAPAKRASEGGNPSGPGGNVTLADRMKTPSQRAATRNAP